MHLKLKLRQNASCIRKINNKTVWTSMITVKPRIEAPCLYQYKLHWPPASTVYGTQLLSEHVMSKSSVYCLVVARVHWIQGHFGRRHIIDILLSNGAMSWLGICRLNRPSERIVAAERKPYFCSNIRTLAFHSHGITLCYRKTQTEGSCLYAQWDLACNRYPTIISTS